MTSASNLRIQRAWVSGASSGIGAAVARALLEEGAEVWGTSRSVERLAALKLYPNFHATTFELAASVGGAAFEAHVQEAGGFDLVVNNAGYGVFSAFEAVGSEVWEAQLAAMIQGSVRVAQAALKEFRKKGKGTLVNVSSLAAEFPLPFMSGYNVSKAALSALSESLMFETRGSRIVVIDFRPGDYRTPFNQSILRSSGESEKGSRMERAWFALEKNLAEAPPPEKAARDLLAAVKRGRPGVVRSGGIFQSRIAPAMAGLAPARWRRALTARYFGVS